MSSNNFHCIERDWYKKSVLVAITVLGALLMGCSESSVTTDPEELETNNDPMTVTIAGYAPRGIGSVLGEGQASVIRKSYPGSNVVYEPGNPAGGILMLSNQDRSFALNGTLELFLARNARPPFDKPYGEGLTAVTTLAPESAKVHVYGRAAFLDEHQITSIADLREREIAANIGINQPGNIWVRAVVDAVLSEYGISADDIETWGGSFVEDNVAGMHDLMKDRRVDLMISGSYAPDGRIVELNASTPVRFVHFTEEESKRIADRLSLESAVIPSGTYDFQPDDAHVPVSSHMIIAGPAATFEESYKIARALVENLDVYRATHPALRSMTKESVVPKGPGIVIHPGAAAYYKEVGLLKDQ